MPTTKNTINLAYKTEDWDAPCPKKGKKRKMKTAYPTFYLNGDNNEGDMDALGDVPEEGYAIIGYHIKERTKRERDSEEEGKKITFTMDMEVKSIEPLPDDYMDKKSYKKSSTDDDESAVDAGLDEATKESS